MIRQVMTDNRKLLVQTLQDVGGKVEDKSGRATGLLYELMFAEGDPYTSRYFIKFLLDADRAGIIKRKLKGKRCYEIALVEKGEPIQLAPVEVPQAPEPDASVDYRRIADELLDLVLEKASAQPAAKIEELNEEIARLSRSLRDEMATVQSQKHLIGQHQDEIKALKSELFHVRTHLHNLEDQFDKAKKIAAQNGGRAFSDAKRAVLNDLMSAPKHVDKGD